MINETKKRIEAYKAALPGLKERITAVALLLAMSVAMMTSATYAWIVLSRSPEVEGMATNVTSNGSLEIALAKPDGSLPDESAIGDSAATPGQTLVSSNLTWGNMVNLSDASYGLQAISLRPALLSGFNLTQKPLYGATYGDDGRVTGVSEMYEYVTYTKDATGKYYFAAASSQPAGCYGVRGIAAIKYDNTTANATLEVLQGNVLSAFSAAETQYVMMINGTTLVDETSRVSCMDALAALIELYVDQMAENIGADDYKADFSGVVTYTYRVMEEFQKILELEGEALVSLANLQVYATDTTKTTEYFNSIDALLAASKSTLNSLGVSLQGLEPYRTDVANLKKSMDELEPWAVAFDPDTGPKTYTYTTAKKDANGAVVKDENGNTVMEDVTTSTVEWNVALATPVSRLVDIPNAELNGIKIGTLGADDATTILGMLDGSIQDVVITKGLLANFEKRIGGLLDKNKITVTIHIDATVTIIRVNEDVTAYVRTSMSANDKSTATLDQEKAFSMGVTGPGTDAVAEDTYGMAIDMWVRSNAQNTILTLEGNILYETRDATCKDKNGNDAVLYTMKYDGGIYDVYQLVETDDQSNEVTNWYDAHSNTLIGSAAELTVDAGYSFEKQTVDVVVGFAGENRVWENWDEIDKMMTEGMIDANFSTQGSGSCYVFYAENEADQVRILDMLKAFTVAFLNKEGNHIATAKLDVEHAYTINGKVTVPMKMTAGVTYTDEEGKEKIGIMSLAANQATWITAVVYLDGMMMTNEDVLSVGEIEGRLNLQYGSSVSLTTMENEDLLYQYRQFTAEATSGGKTSDSTSNPITFEYDANAKEITVTVTSTGDQPSTLSGFFVRAVSDTQGAKGETVAFTPNSDGTWSGVFHISKPGSYSFRSVLADGVEYDLIDFPTVVINGLGVGYVDCNLAEGVTMTSNSFIDAPVTVQVNATPDLMPKQVRAQFWSEDNQVVNAVLTYDSVSEVWTGTARFNSSGAYTLRYVVMDGEETLLPENQQTTHILYLGITAKVTTTYPNLEFVYEGGIYEFPMRVELYDDTGNELSGLQDVRLYYRLSGSLDDGGGMEAVVRWNNSTGYYEGTFETDSPGEYIFNRVSISEYTDGVATSIIDKAASYPTFRLISPDPPKYLDGDSTAKYQFVPNGGATMVVDMQHTSTAVVWALIQRHDGTTYFVKGTGQTLDTNQKTDYFTFAVPQVANKQDGEWTIKALLLQGVYIMEEGKMYGNTNTAPTLDDYEKGSKGSFYVMEEVAADDVTTYVVHSVNITYMDPDGKTGYTGDSNLGKTNGTVTGAFMDAHTVSGVKVSIKDWNGEAIQGLTDAAMLFSYDFGSTLGHGGYTTTDTSSATVKSASVPLTATNDPAVYILPDRTYQRAGTYTRTLTYKVNGTEYTYDKTLTYEVWSVTPTVKITAISPSGSHTTAIPEKKWYGTVGKSVNVTSSISSDQLSATIYSYCTVSRGNVTMVTEPQVTITLTGFGNAIEANLVFTTTDNDGTVYLYTGANRSGQTDAFTWQSAATTTCKRYVGYNDSGNCDNSIYAGTLTADTLVLEHGSIEYTVEISTITINNNEPS